MIHTTWPGGSREPGRARVSGRGRCSPDLRVPPRARAAAAVPAACRGVSCRAGVSAASPAPVQGPPLSTQPRAALGSQGWGRPAHDAHAQPLPGSGWAVIAGPRGARGRTAGSSRSGMLRGRRPEVRGLQGTARELEQPQRLGSGPETRLENNAAGARRPGRPPGRWSLGAQIPLSGGFLWPLLQLGAGGGSADGGLGLGIGCGHGRRGQLRTKPKGASVRICGQLGSTRV